ncbi:COG1272: Predicted membrane protein hemolysin III homolog [hydrothermal vent metagenome]|uniref:COG1272: Predicted membrane protein hemolysin III homolog n=1 Tax=hydrothermal vent metagenome TaxID=652676 RepID=A0A3B0YC39_9ZZZZ
MLQLLQQYPVYAIVGFTEPFSSITHLLAAIVFLIMAIFLIRRGRGKLSRMIFLSIFSFACFFQFSMSGVYHLLDIGTARDILQRLDHAAIFTLIAGSFTSIHGILFTGIRRWGILLLVWSIAIGGIILKSIFFTAVPEWLSLSLYLGLGWIGLASAIMLYQQYGLRYVTPLVFSGVAYTTGAVLEFLRAPILVTGIIGPHELFHIAVIVGVFLHWRFTWHFADGSAQKDQKI